MNGIRQVIAKNGTAREIKEFGGNETINAGNLSRSDLLPLLKH